MKGIYIVRLSAECTDEERDYTEELLRALLRSLRDHVLITVSRSATCPSGGGSVQKGPEVER